MYFMNNFLKQEKIKRLFRIQISFPILLLNKIISDISFELIYI